VRFSVDSVSAIPDGEGRSVAFSDTLGYVPIKTETVHYQAILEDANCAGECCKKRDGGVDLDGDHWNPLVCVRIRTATS
jgi:hypothetical protein